MASVNEASSQAAVSHVELPVNGDAPATKVVSHVEPPVNGNGPANKPTKGLSSIEDTIEDVRKGKFVLVVDGENSKTEGYLIIAASKVTADSVAFILKHGTGVRVSMKEEGLERLNIPVLVNDEEKLSSAFAISVDATIGTASGGSAGNRAATVLALASKESKAEDFIRPGHVFPVKYRQGGVLKKPGPTEASLDLAVLAGLEPAGVFSKLAGGDELRQFAKKENIKIVSIADLIRYRMKTENLAEHTSAANIPTRWGTFVAHCYTSVLDGIENVAMVKGEIGEGLDVLVRVHSECLTGDIFGSAKCDCGNQLALAMEQIDEAGRGVLVYLRGHEGRGIGLGNKLLAYKLQEAGRDTVQANEDLGLPVDSRDYGVGVQMLLDLGVKSVKLMTNNPTKCSGLEDYGLVVSGRVPMKTFVTEENTRYLETKRAKMGHMYNLGSNGGSS